MDTSPKKSQTPKTNVRKDKQPKEIDSKQTVLIRTKKTANKRKTLEQMASWLNFFSLKKKKKYHFCHRSTKENTLQLCVAGIALLTD